MPRTLHRCVLLAVVLFLASTCASAPRRVAPAPGLESVAAELERVIHHELATKGIPALSIALVDGDTVVWAAGFGDADPARDRAADADTVYRVGSVSKLFTDLAIMQLVERGVLDLDAPVATFLPGFAPRNGFGGAITLRQLTAHRAGLVREPPAGHYFDDRGTDLAATVASLNATDLVAAPGTLTKYSNAGIAVLGAVLEHHYHEPYAELMRERVLRPLGLGDAAFAPDPAIERRLATARMWAYDGREFDAPTFQLGMAPAGSLYASVLDLAGFLRVLHADGVGPDGPIVEPATLHTMLTPTLDPDGNPTRFGIGFALNTLKTPDGGEHRRAGHGGAIYGFSTDLSFLPDDRLGVAVAASMDVTNATVSRIAQHALQCMLAHREGRPLPVLPLGQPVPAARAAKVAGRYRAENGQRADLVLHGDRLLLEQGGQIARVRLQDGVLTVDDRHRVGPAITEQDHAIQIGGTVYTRVDDPRPAPCPERWRDLIGEYGWDHNILFVREKDGHLEALIEWFYFDEMTEVAPDVFALPTNRGLYPHEPLTFQRDPEGQVVRAMLGPVAFERRHTQESGATFRIEPLHDAEELRRRARAASPPKQRSGLREADLVDLTAAVPGLSLDVRYATTNNFMGTVFYPEARAFLQRPAAAALAEVQEALADERYALRVFDAYRPWSVTKMFWDATPESMKQFVADPSQGSRHNRGCALDLTLVDLATGKPAPMPAGYDEFTERSFPEYPGGTSLERWNRELLRTTMESHGFRVYEWEWWHFDYHGWEEYPILNRTFAEIDEGL